MSRTCETTFYTSCVSAVCLGLCCLPATTIAAFIVGISALLNKNDDRCTTKYYYCPPIGYPNLTVKQDIFQGSSCHRSNLEMISDVTVTPSIPHNNSDRKTSHYISCHDVYQSFCVNPNDTTQSLLAPYNSTTSQQCIDDRARNASNSGWAALGLICGSAFILSVCLLCTGLAYYANKRPHQRRNERDSDSDYYPYADRNNPILYSAPSVGGYNQMPARMADVSPSANCGGYQVGQALNPEAFQVGPAIHPLVQ